MANKKPVSKQTKKPEQEIHKPPKSRFMAMSKIIGIIVLSFLAIIVIYSLIEMHITQTFDNLSQLIISAFGLAGVYAGFYLTMAKMEHVEAEKSMCLQEIERLKKQKNCDNDTIEMYRQEVQALQEQLSSIIAQEIHSGL